MEYINELSRHLCLIRMNRRSNTLEIVQSIVLEF